MRSLSASGQSFFCITAPLRNIASPRFTPVSGETVPRQPSARFRVVPSAAITVQQHGCRSQTYSITASARASSMGGISRPSALAVLRLITSSNFVGCCTGRSAGVAPLRILST